MDWSDRGQRLFRNLALIVALAVIASLIALIVAG